MLEAHRLLLIDSANQLAAAKHLTDAYRREVHRTVGGTPAAGEPSRLSVVRQRTAAIAGIFGADRPVYATPMENLRAAQAAAEELDNLEGDKKRHMMECLQQLLDAAAFQQEAARRAA